MAENTKIQWCHHTFNHIRGCTKVAAGCANCYADALSKRNPGTLGVWGDHGTRVLASPSQWKLPLKWNREAEQAGERRRVFCASLADVFEDWTGRIRNAKGLPLRKSITSKEYIPDQSLYGPESGGVTLNDIRRDLFALIDATPHLDWLLLTKRPENVRRMWPHNWRISGLGGYAETVRKNVWLGTSIATQADADKNIPELLKCRDLSPVLFVSAEPLVGAVRLDRIDVNRDAPHYDCLLGRDELGMVRGGHKVDWLIVGGESGSHARPCDVAWIRSLKDQAQAAGVPVFVKQLGANILDRDSTSASGFPDRMCWPEGFRQDVQRIILRDPKGGDPAEWPADLRVQEYPHPAI